MGAPIVLASAGGLIFVIYCVRKWLSSSRDREVRCFVVPNEEAARIVVRIIEKFSRRRTRFEDKDRIVFSDGSYVLIKDDQSATSNSLSFTTKDPQGGVDWVLQQLRHNGFRSEARRVTLPGSHIDILIVSSSALTDWEFMFLPLEYKKKSTDEAGVLV